MPQTLTLRRVVIGWHQMRAEHTEKIVKKIMDKK